MRALSIDRVESELRRAIDGGKMHDIEHWGSVLDELEQRYRKGVPRLLDSALWYASNGLHVFALKPSSKQPYDGSRGLHDATTNLDDIKRIWRRAPSSNIGIATGHVVDVVDIDGPAGNVELSRLLADVPHALDKCIGVCSTPRAGGRHFYFKARAVWGNGAKLMRSIDVRARGGYVVAPPSTTELGRYSWTRLLDF